MIKYLGSKRTLLDSITRIIKSAGNVSTVLDLFSGTARVGHALKSAGFVVHSNDHNAYASTLATCYVQADKSSVEADAQKLIAEFNSLAGKPGYFTETFCEKSRFFQPKNGARIDAIREAIASKSLPPELSAVLLVSLMEAADRVDSTTGVQMAYLKQWAARAHNDLNLRMPDLRDCVKPGHCRAYNLEAKEAAKIKVDLAYLDPPYNQHSYLGNYHIWESLVLWDKPEVYGIACKRLDVRERKSRFNSKKEFKDAMREMLSNLNATSLLVSFSNEGFVTRDEMLALLEHVPGKKRHVCVIEHDYKRYVGAQIGIHNLKGEKVGQVSHLRNTEYMFLCTHTPVDTTMLTSSGKAVDTELPLGYPFDLTKPQGPS
jgi:adenine-specific DNA-methyltransferase